MEAPGTYLLLMCGRYDFHASRAQVEAQFRATVLDDWQPRWNVAPMTPAPVVRAGEDGRIATLHRWGLVPSWAKDPKAGARMINARAETAPERPAFRTAFRRRRCLVPADGFYEWQAAGGRKQPWYFRPRGGGLFGFAGLWEYWEGPDGALLTFTILTSAPNPLMAPVHDRMPVIVAPEDYGAWLDPETKPADLMRLLRPYPETGMEAWPVGTEVNRASSEGPGLVEPLTAGVR